MILFLYKASIHTSQRTLRAAIKENKRDISRGKYARPSSVRIITNIHIHCAEKWKISVFKLTAHIPSVASLIVGV